MDVALLTKIGAALGREVRKSPIQTVSALTLGSACGLKPQRAQKEGLIQRVVLSCPLFSGSLRWFSATCRGGSPLDGDRGEHEKAALDCGEHAESGYGDAKPSGDDVGECQLDARVAREIESRCELCLTYP
jgi:hypothetical protein